MPTNANTFNSRVTSEALEAKFRQVFPSQGGAELPQDLFASGVLQPVIDFSSVAEGSVLPQNLQQAWDFSTGQAVVNNATTTLINNPGFWLVDVNAAIDGTAANNIGQLYISDGLANKVTWEVDTGNTATNYGIDSNPMVFFLRSGDSLIGRSTSLAVNLNIWWRQVADVNGNLVNPLGFTFQ